MNSPPLITLSILFFFSGFSSLLYEIVWMRILSLHFGTGHYAVITTLCSFMIGLALGGYGGGKFEKIKIHPLLVYGIFEGSIGIFALLFRPLLKLSVVSTSSLLSPENIVIYPFVVFLLSIGLLIIPTFLMGAAFPVIGSYVSPTFQVVGIRAGTIYAINLTGGALGALGTGFFLLPRLGLTGALLSGVVINSLISISSFLLYFKKKERPEKVVAIETEDHVPLKIEDIGSYEERKRGRGVFPILVILSVSLSALSSMLYEVVWTRYLTGIIGSSVYSFTIILFTFLLSLGIGSLVSSILCEKEVETSAHLLLCEIIAGVCAGSTLFILPLLPRIFSSLFSIAQASPSLLFSFIILQTGLSFLIIFPSAFFCGMVFPFGLKIVSVERGTKGESISLIYLFTTFGSVVGSLLTGFILIPGLGLDDSLKTGVLIGMMAGFLILPFIKVKRSLIYIVCLVGCLSAITFLLLPDIHPLKKMSGIYYYINRGDGSNGKIDVDDYELLYYKDGATASVTVCREKEKGGMWLSSNGKVEASTDVDLPTQLLMGHLPLIFHPGEPEDVLVIGLASGITLGATLLHGKMSVDVVEIEEAMVEASSFFEDWNGDPLHREGVRLIVGDARSFLGLGDKRYDVIISEPSNPWITGVSNLFTLEFFEMGRKKLKEDGLFCQWMQVYSLFKDDMKSLLSTFKKVFPKMLVLTTLKEADLILIGFKDRYPESLHRIYKRIEDRPVFESLERAGVKGFTYLLSLIVHDGDTIGRVTGDTTLNTDENMRLEFNAPLSMYADTIDENFFCLMEKSDGVLNFLSKFTDMEIFQRLYVDLGYIYIERGMPIMALKVADMVNKSGYLEDSAMIRDGARRLFGKERR